MKYLEALDIVDNHKHKKKKNLNIISSFNSDPLNLFTKAIFAKKKINLNIYNSQFNTLKQTLIKIKPNKNLNLVLLCPWDFCEKLNWRSGIDSKINYFNEVDNDIKFLTELIISKKKILKVIYFDLPIPETLINLGENKKLSINIKNAYLKISNKVLTYKSLDLTKFIDIGFPFETKKIYKICKDIYNVLLSEKQVKKNNLKNKIFLNKNYDIGTKKILATDFDGVLWSGVVADDGYKNIKCANDVTGYKHYLFQSLIKKLLKRGIILIGVTRNKLNSAKKAFLNKSNILVENDFIKIYATYKNKSESIKQACHDLNLSLDSVVFVDDNLIEINEVKESIPMIRTVLFPKNEKDFSKFINRINLSFQKNYITKEDKTRTLSYKNITFKKNIKFDSKFNLNKFLTQLSMKLIIIKKNLKEKKELKRPLQLINKTNQFNLNGDRLSENNLFNILKKGGTLFSGLFSDKTGNYGEIITILINKKKKILSFVMSCRVFQKNIELAFLYFLIKQKIGINNFHYKKTKSNIPLQNFIKNNLSLYMDKNYNFLNQVEFLKDFKKNIKNYKIKFK